MKPIGEAVVGPRAKPLSPIIHSSWGTKDFVPYTNNISINVKGSLQSWLADDNIIVNAIFPEDFRCIISGPSESGKTYLSKHLVMTSIQFHKLYIICPTGHQYNYKKYKNFEFISAASKLITSCNTSTLHFIVFLSTCVKKLLFFSRFTISAVSTNSYAPGGIVLTLLAYMKILFFFNYIKNRILNR